MLRRAELFIEDVKKEINVKEVYVVGSRARGDYLDTSDIDLVIISDDFKGMRYIDRMEKLSKYRRAKIYYFTFTNEEWENPQSLYIEEMKKEAKKLDELLRNLES
ncbi:DNA polymerase beta domain protein [Acidianus hospitalis W1]|uniref:DNA polymerase beta domain protein n=1 Tax=Acidianus hospitalis (strain W1) TaxID=933801 RepID=F4B5K5_ACIHW|nr:nucleotidyltransferase [Acidianus hospitalis]AEE94429.1 DNA polymerase beta domain protein [Acidianus hospitalis W1]